MLRSQRLLKALILLAYTARMASAQTAPPGYAIQDRIVVRTDTVLLFSDARLTPALRDSLWGEYDPCGVPADHPLRMYCQVDLDTLFRPALIELRRASGSAPAPLRLTKPRAALSSIQLQVLPVPEVFVTEDDTPEFGTYRGPVTRVLLLPPQGPLRWAEVTEMGHRSRAELRLLVTGKASWVVTRDEILSIRCQPRAVADSVAFDITLSRLRPRPDGSWERVSHTEEGFWETDMGLPDLEVFPQWPGATRSNHRMKLTSSAIGLRRI